MLTPRSKGWLPIPGSYRRMTVPAQGTTTVQQDRCWGISVPRQNENLSSSSRALQRVNIEKPVSRPPSAATDTTNCPLPMGKKTRPAARGLLLTVMSPFHLASPACIEEARISRIEATAERRNANYAGISAGW